MKRTFLALIVVAGSLGGQEADRVTVPFSDPSGPKRLTASLLHGSITVKAHAGKDVIVEAQNTGASSSRRQAPPGMRRIDGGATGLSVEESSNTIKVGAASHSRRVDLTILVPAETAVKVSTVNSGNLSVEGVSGEIDADNLNGNVTITNVSGAVVAHSLNGKVLVTLNRVTPGKAMSFSTLNGDVDVTLPADVKANVKMKSEHGDIFSDFEITLKPSATPAAETQSSKGKYRLRFDRAMAGTLNGGGPEMQFTTLNGTIYIRKQK